METLTPKTVCCPNCQHEFDPSFAPVNDVEDFRQPVTATPLSSDMPPAPYRPGFIPRPEKNDTETKLWIFIGKLIVLCVAVVVTWLVKSHSASSTPAAEMDSVLTADTAIMSVAPSDSAKSVVQTPAETKGETWSYDTTVNKMTSGKTYFASINANETLSLHSPYDGYNQARLCVRRKEGVNNVFLTIDKGQFMFGVEETAIRVRFDSEKSQTFYCSASSDSDPTVMFINPNNLFIRKLKKAKRMLIEATLYQDGTQQMEFNTAGFRWNH